MEAKGKDETAAQLEALREEMRRIAAENRILKQELAGEHTGWPVRIPPAPEVPPASQVPPSSPVPEPSPFPPALRGEGAREGLSDCPVCGTGRPLGARACSNCEYPFIREPEGPQRETPVLQVPVQEGPTLSERAAAWFDSILKSLRENGTERLVGEKLFNYAGMVLLVLGGAFFLKYTAGLLGPAGKFAIGALAASALVAMGEVLRRREGYAPFSVPVIGGGWILLYYTVFAAHYLPQARVIESAALEFALLCASAAGMIFHSLRAKSRPLTAFAFGTAYFVFAITHLGTPSLTVCAVLALAGAVLVRSLGAPELAAINLAGFYLNYFPIFRLALSASPAQAFPAADFWYSLAAATAVHAAYAWLTPRVEEEGSVPWLDAALSLSAVLYAALFYSQVTAFGPGQAATVLLCLSGVLGGLSTLNGQSKGKALPRVQGLLSAVITALALLKLGGAAQQLWGFALASSVFGLAGLWLKRTDLERYGLALGGLAALVHLGHPAEVETMRVAMGAGLAYIGVSGYVLAALGGEAEAKSDVAALRFYGGLSFLLMALWTWFEPPAFAVSAMTLALGLEWLSRRLEAPAFFQQAVLVEAGVGLYSFLIDYGANLPVTGPLTPRLLVTAALGGAYAYLLFACEVPEGSFLGVKHSDWRRMSAWFMSGVLAFGVYCEHRFGPRVRLPMWAASALFLLALGRRRGIAGNDLRVQGYLLVCGTAAEAVLSYLVRPQALLGTLGGLETSIFAAASLALLAPLAWPAWAETPSERTEELAAAHLCSSLSLGLLAAFIYKEAAGTMVTLGWSLLGVAFVLAGLALRRQALRIPGVALLVLCVLKALFQDLTGLILPYRVLSYMVLGGLLVLASYLYVRLSREADSDAV